MMITEIRNTYLRLGPAGRARVWLGLAGLILLLVILFGGKPWNVRLEAGEDPSTRDYMKMWFWPAAVGNFFFVGILALMAPWWTRPAQSVPDISIDRAPPKWFWPLVSLAAVFLLCTAWPRMDQSVWHDEANRVKNETVGSYKILPDGTAEFRPVSWLDTFFFCRMPNHVLQSAASRACHDFWESVSRPAGFPLSETALRIPSLIAGVAGLAMLAILLKALGLPGTGVLAAWILALHPWYMRYASEARSYGIALALVPAVLFFLLRSLQTDRTRWWAAFGLAQFALVYAYVTAVYVPLVANLLVFLVMIAMRRQGLDFARVWPRWLVTNLLSGALFIQLYAPCVPQMVNYLSGVKAAGGGWTLDYFWMGNFLAHLLGGIPWTYTKMYPSDHLEMLCWAIDHPAVFVAIVFFGVGFLVLGIRNMVVRGPFHALVAGAFLLPAVLAFINAKLTGTYLFEWYVIFILPGVCALVAVGMADSLPTGKSWRIGVIAMSCAMLAGYWYWTQPQRALMMAEPLQPYRDAVLLTRPSLDPNHPGQRDIITACFHAKPLVYDPRIQMIRSVDEMQALVREADASGKQLYFNIAYPETAKLSEPHLYAYLLKSGLFEHVRELQGMYPELDLDVYRYKGAGSESVR